MSKSRAGELIFSEKQKKKAGRNARPGNRLGKPWSLFGDHRTEYKAGRPRPAAPALPSKEKTDYGSKCLTARPVIADVLLQRVQFLRKPVDSPLQQVADRQNPQKLSIVVDHR